MTLLAFAAERRCCRAPGVVDRYVLPAGPTAANPLHAAAAVDRWDSETDGRTPYRYIDSAAYYASFVNEYLLITDLATMLIYVIKCVDYYDKSIFFR